MKEAQKILTMQKFFFFFVLMFSNRNIGHIVSNPCFSFLAKFRQSFQYQNNGKTTLLANMPLTSIITYLSSAHQNLLAWIFSQYDVPYLMETLLTSCVMSHWLLGQLGCLLISCVMSDWLSCQLGSMKVAMHKDSRMLIISELHEGT